jgi:hypothetical protein
MTTMIACPQCGSPNEDPQGIRRGDAFCSECDYPLFFVMGIVERIEDDDSALSRLPGVGGRDRRVWQPCRECGELNPRDGVHCLRCGAVLKLPVEEPELMTANVEMDEAEYQPVEATHELRCPRMPWAIVGFLVGTGATLLAVAFNWIG